MKRSVAFLSAILLLALAEFVPAAVFPRDWKTPSDGLLTYDDVNQREWLDLSQTLLNQFAGSTLEEKYQSVRTQLAPGGSFEAFVVGKRLDVTAFAESAGIDTGTRQFTTNAAAMQRLIELLDPTRTQSSGHLQSRGFIDELDNSPQSVPQRLEVIFDYFPPQPTFVGDAAVLITGGDDNRAATATAVMLYRVVVPEPSVYAAAAMFFVAFWCVLPRSGLGNRFRCSRTLALSQSNIIQQLSFKRS